MKKKAITPLFAACALAACLFAACGSSKISTGNKPLANAVYGNDSVSLAAYTGLKAEKKNYRVTDQAVKNATRERLAEFIEYNSVSRASQTGDSVYADYTASPDGADSQKVTDYCFVIGENEFGKAFDEKLTGVFSGDELDFTLKFAADSDTEFAGNTVRFEIKVTDIQEEIFPDITDSFIKENTEYKNRSEFEAAMRQSVIDSYEIESEEELREALLKQVTDASSVLQYTKDEYEAAKKTVDDLYLSYAGMLGTDIDSLYESLEVTEADIEEEIQTTLFRKIIVNAIVENENLSVSDTDFEEGVARYMELNGYTSKDEFFNDYGKEGVRAQLLEDKALQFLADHAVITEVDADHE